MLPVSEGVNFIVTFFPTGKSFVILSDGKTTLLPQPSFFGRLKISVKGEPCSVLMLEGLKPFLLTVIRTVFGCASFYLTLFFP